MDEITSLTTTKYRYTYPANFFYFEVVLFSFSGIMLMIAWIPVLWLFSGYGSVSASLFRTTVVLNAVVIAILLMFFFIKNELRATVFLLTNGKLVKKTSYDVKQIGFSEMRSITAVRFPAGSGKIVVKSDCVKINVPLVLQNSRNLIERLVAAGQTNVLLPDKAALQSLYEACELSEQAGKRLQTEFIQLVSASLLMLPLNFFIGAFFWDLSFVSIMIWMVMGPFFPVGFFALSDMLIRRYEKAALNKDLEKSINSIKTTILWRMACIGIGFYLVSGFLFKAAVV